MFARISSLVTRWPLLVVAAWIALAVGLRFAAPGWDQVTKDDNVRFFPPDYPSVIGQGLLERGFPRDAASSQVVLICERASGPLTGQDFAYVDGMATRFVEFARTHPELGFKKLDTYRTPVIGPRLLGDGGKNSRATLTIIALNGTYLAKTTRIAVDKILGDWLTAEQALPPEGLALAITGSAVVGHDINAAANESIENTTWTTVILVVIILLLVYRSPLLAMVPLVTIALSVLVSRCAIALLTTVPGLGFQVINITRVFVIVVLFGAGTDYCLFLIARYSRGAGAARSDRCAARGDWTGRRRLWSRRPVR